MKLSLSSQEKSILKFIFIVLTCIFGLAVVFVNVENILGLLKKVLQILNPFIFGIFFSLMLYSPVEFFEKKIFKMIKKNKLRRAISLLSVYLIVTILLVVLLIIVIPQLIDSVSSLTLNISSYFSSFSDTANNFVKAINLPDNLSHKLFNMWEKLVNNILDYLAGSVSNIVDTTKNVISGLFSFLFGLVISVYFIAGKEKLTHQLKKLSKGTLGYKLTDWVSEFFLLTYKVFNKYLLGQIIDSIFLGIVTFIILSIFKIPYALLVSVIITVTNIIPIFGPIIGAIPCVLIILVISPVKALIFTIIIIILQQIEGNIICPRIVGSTTGLGAFWVTFAIFLGGGLFGVIGLILSVPTLSVIFFYLNRLVNYRLGKSEISKTIEI